MESDHKKRVADALHRYFEKEDRKYGGTPASKPRQKRNEKPEKLVEKACLDWMRKQNWLVEIYEAKSTFSESRQRWVGASMKAGTSDCMGSLPNGIGVAIEFKAPGKLSTFNSEKRTLQRNFIVNRINSNNFACVVDSVDRLQLIYQTWRDLRESNSDLNASREYLISMLPKKKKTGLESDLLFDDE